MNYKTIYRLLKYKQKKWKMINGLTLCRHLGIPINRLKELDNIEGVGSFGPVNDGRLKRWQQHVIYARRTFFY